MTGFPDTQQLAELRGFDKPCCVTIYAPAASSAEADPNRIEMKNLLRQASIALGDTALTQRDIKKTLRPVKDLLKNGRFWSQHRGSLALFVHADFFRWYQIPTIDIPHEVTVEQGFNLEPLLAAMRDNRSYFVLTLGHKDVQLYEGDRYNLEPVPLKDFPADMREVLRLDENPQAWETHSIAPGRAGKASEAMHGQYNVSQVDKQRLEKFFRRIDHRLHRYLAKRNKPLILAGVGYLLPIYRKVNTYTNLWPEGIRSNVKGKQPAEIRHKAWALITSR